MNTAMDKWASYGFPCKWVEKIVNFADVKTYKELKDVCSMLEDVEMWINGEFEDEAFEEDLKFNPFNNTTYISGETAYNARCVMLEHSKIKSMLEAQFVNEKFKELNIILNHTEEDDETSPTWIHAINGFLFYADDLMEEDEEVEMINDICHSFNLTKE